MVNKKLLKSFVTLQYRIIKTPMNLRNRAFCINIHPQTTAVYSSAKKLDLNISYVNFSYISHKNYEHLNQLNNFIFKQIFRSCMFIR